MSDDRRLTLFYDGACPLCQREVAFYARLDRAGRIVWHDVSRDTRGMVAEGLPRREALRRIYVRCPDGRQLSGARAFVEVWRCLPGFRWLAPLVALPPFIWLAEGLYRAFLVVRPRLTGRRGCDCDEDA